MTFAEGRSGEGDIPGSLELAALARWLAEAGAAHGASGTGSGGQLPRVQVTGFGDEGSHGPADELARRTGQQRADALRARLLSSAGRYLGQLGADPAIAGSLLPAGLAADAAGQGLAAPGVAGQAVATIVRAQESAAPTAGPGGYPGQHGTAPPRPMPRRTVTYNVAGASMLPDLAGKARPVPAQLAPVDPGLPGGVTQSSGGTTNSVARLERQSRWRARRQRRGATSSLPDPSAAAAPSAAPPSGLPPGWVWLDRDRGVAVPIDLAGGSQSGGAGWVVAQPGEGRSYAVHLGTGRIAVASESGVRIVVGLSYGWFRVGSGIVHQSSGLALRGPGARIGWAGPEELGRLAGRVDQLDREDLLVELIGWGALPASEVPELPAGPGWQQVTDRQGGTRWAWNTLGPVVELPAGLARGRASGQGNLCLIDSLRQLIGSLGHGAMTVEDLRGLLLSLLPVDNEAHHQLATGTMVDVWSALDAFIMWFRVRLQVFQHVGEGHPAGRGHATILPSVLRGPAFDEAGNPTPVLHLYWRGMHFEPLFPGSGEDSSSALPGNSPVTRDQLAVRVRGAVGAPPPYGGARRLPSGGDGAGGESAGPARPGGQPGDAGEVRAETGTADARPSVELPLSAARLEVEWASAVAGGDLASLAGCVAVVGRFLRAVYPRLRLPSGDDALRLGGVAGARERLAPSAEWGRVRSWRDLERAVADAGAGASAVVLVSFAGRREGHALVLHATAEGLDATATADAMIGGLRWADPAGAVTSEQPEDVSRAVAAWAVVVRRDGRVAEPGAWAAPESAGGVGMLADPPLRHDFGAMGAEIERHNILLLAAGDLDFLANMVVLTSKDQLVSVVVDTNTVWFGDDGVLYEDEIAGVPGRRRVIAVPETVTAPWSVLGEPDRPDVGRVLERVRDVERLWSQVPETRRATPAAYDAVSLADLFPDSDYDVDERFRDVRVVHYPELHAPAPLLVHLSVGVPLGGGVLAVLDELEHGTGTGIRPPSKAVVAAVRFGWQVAQLYVAEMTGRTPTVEEVMALTPDADVVRVVEVMALAFVQVSGVLRWQASPWVAYRKKLMPVVPRQSLHKISSELGGQLQGFFGSRADSIRELFAAEFPRMSRTASNYTQADLWDVRLSRPADASVGTVGDLFDEILRPAPEGPRIGRDVLDVGNADSGADLDRRNVNGLPLLVLEMRGYVAWMADSSGLEGLIQRLTGVAEQGDDAARFAHRLPASSEGQDVLAAVRAVATGREGQRGAQRRNLLDAVASYLDRFPLQRPVLEQALQPVAARLREHGLAGPDDDETRTAARIGALLGDGHQVTQQEVSAVVLLARRLGMPAGLERQWLSSLGRAVWLHDRDFPAVRQVMEADVARAFGFLTGAAWAYYDAEWADLTRLADLVREVGSRAEVASAGLPAEHRRPHGTGDGSPVNVRQSREELAARVRRVIEAWRSPVTQQALGAELRAGLDDVVGPQQPRVLGAGVNQSTPDPSQPTDTAAQASQEPGGPQASGSTPGPARRRRSIAWNVAGSSMRPGPAGKTQPASPQLAPVDPELPGGAARLSGGTWNSAAHLQRQSQRLELLSRAVSLLGGRHGFTRDEVAAGMTLADRLDPHGRANLKRFDELGRTLGLHSPSAGETSSATRQQTFGLLVSASWVYGDDLPSLEQLADLRVLADVVRDLAAEERPVTVQNLKALFRQVRGQPVNAGVTPREVRDLASAAGEARALLPAGQAVTISHLADIS